MHECYLPSESLAHHHGQSPARVPRPRESLPGERSVSTTSHDRSAAASQPLASRTVTSNNDKYVDHFHSDSFLFVCTIRITVFLFFSLLSLYHFITRVPCSIFFFFSRSSDPPHCRLFRLSRRVTMGLGRAPKCSVVLMPGCVASGSPGFVTRAKSCQLPCSTILHSPFPLLLLPKPFSIAPGLRIH
jgi:hypothetical protein